MLCSSRFALGRLTTSTSSRFSTASVYRNQWETAISNAEKVVGYPPSFLSLRCLLSDEFSNIALHMRKLVGTGHPLLQTAKRIFTPYEGTQTRGLINLLVSQLQSSSNVTGNVNERFNYESEGESINSRQRQLAETTEMIHAAFLIHLGIVDVNTIPEDEAERRQKITSGNRLALLAGDYLLATASNYLAELRNTYVVESIGEAIAAFVEGRFLMSRIEAYTFEEWQRRMKLWKGQLLANSCYGTLELAGAEKEAKQAAHDLGMNLVLAHQARIDLDSSSTVTDPASNIWSLPVILLAESQGAVPPKGLEISSWLSDREQEVASCDWIRDRTDTLCSEYCDSALSALHVFRDSEAKQALTSLIEATRRSSSS